jgi:uncharacterized protein YdhG (YjbR/CyaY superfamily)
MAVTNFESVDAYLATKSEDVQKTLQRVRSTLRKALPNAQEVISYQIPALRLPEGVVIWFAGWKEHFSLYPASKELVEALADELFPYEISKGTIRFPLKGAVPVRLVAQIAKLRAAEVAERARSKKASPKKRPSP